MSEHRVDPRIEEHADVLVKLQSSPHKRDLEGKVFPSHSLDISLHGMRLEVDMPVRVGALLELEIKLSRYASRYHHMGNVIWSEEIEDEDTVPCHLHDVGIRFRTGENPQFVSWAEAIAGL